MHSLESSSTRIAVAQRRSDKVEAKAHKVQAPEVETVLAAVKDALQAVEVQAVQAVKQEAVDKHRKVR